MKNVIKGNGLLRAIKRSIFFAMVYALALPMTHARQAQSQPPLKGPSSNAHPGRRNSVVRIIEYTQTTVPPETFILLPNGHAPSPWQRVGRVFDAYKNPGPGLHPIYECQNAAGGVAAWDFYPSLDKNCEGAGKLFSPIPIGYLADVPSTDNPRVIYRCDWVGGGFSHLVANDLTVDKVCLGSNGWVRAGGLGFAPN